MQPARRRGNFIRSAHQAPDHNRTTKLKLVTLNYIFERPMFRLPMLDIFRGWKDSDYDLTLAQPVLFHKKNTKRRLQFQFLRTSVERRIPLC